ncbi:ABC transporter ATP-binding protein [Microvirga puerhi]|uniref:Sn-glycerol-3-phosphate ABC transporter ATP-binding protein UgpC n=1 Tax=Microvirga puerhi TaxID=2876078 RepID=A0ABS7VU23_9HYPH|nr:sn-glycerol-3-phosphate ABC transporter ATP-binding protein UgpC [Microvirga puerhi]MBZ6078555.1 sn-glycerol-3-phosphate ABC transporter ATP-binding protein UgpC [Microvirga puerhi]
MATIALEGLVKQYGKATVVHGIDLHIRDGEFVVLVGPSGCGKSTTLRMIAGLEDISAGTIKIGDRVVNEAEPKDRNIAMVFQNYAIYPHMSVAQNIGFGLYKSTLPEREKRARISEAARVLGLDALLDRRPSQLSGGQRQRVAIGRAMVRDPTAFLFDEPLSNLDAQLRAQMRIEIKKLHQRLGKTIVFVTHDQVEAMTMADRIVVMRDGRILQVGTPMDLYENPADIFTARFIGSPAMNLLPARLTADADGVRAELPELGASLTLGRFPRDEVTGSQAFIGVRPHDLVVGRHDGQGLTLTGRVSIVEPLGSETLVHIDVAGIPIIASAPGRAIPKVDDLVGVHALTGSLYLFDAETERALCRV